MDGVSCMDTEKTKNSVRKLGTGRNVDAGYECRSYDASSLLVE